MSFSKSTFALFLTITLTIPQVALADIGDIDTGQSESSNTQETTNQSTASPKQGYQLIKNDTEEMDNAFRAIRENRLEEWEKLKATYGEDSPQAQAKKAQIDSMKVELKDRMPRAYAMMERAEGVTLEGIFVSLTNWTLMLAGIVMFGLIIYRSSALIFSPDEEERRDGLKYTAINFLIGTAVMFSAWWIVYSMMDINFSFG